MSDLPAFLRPSAPEAPVQGSDGSWLFSKDIKNYSQAEEARAKEPTWGDTFRGIPAGVGESAMNLIRNIARPLEQAFPPAQGSPSLMKYLSPLGNIGMASDPMAQIAASQDQTPLPPEQFRPASKYAEDALTNLGQIGTPAGRVIGNVGYDIAETTLPFLKGLRAASTAGKIAANAVAGGIAGASAPSESNLETLGKAGTGAGLNAGLGAAFDWLRRAPKAVSSIPENAKSLINDLGNESLPSLLDRMKMGPDAISKHAYELWEKAGKPLGRSDEFWHQAEAAAEAAGTRYKETKATLDALKDVYKPAESAISRAHPLLSMLGDAGKYATNKTGQLLTNPVASGGFTALGTLNPAILPGLMWYLVQNRDKIPDASNLIKDIPIPGKKAP